MQAVATVRPRSHSLTFYYVKLCSCACVNMQTVVAISLSDCSAFACGFLQLGFGYCWLTTAAHSALHIFSLPPCHSFLYQSHWKRKKEKKPRKSPLLKCAGCFPQWPLSQSMSHLFGFSQCLVRTHLELHSTLLPCGNDRTH